MEVLPPDVCIDAIVVVLVALLVLGVPSRYMYFLRSF